MAKNEENTSGAEATDSGYVGVDPMYQNFATESGDPPVLLGDNDQVYVDAAKHQESLAMSSDEYFSAVHPSKAATPQQGASS